MAVEDTAHLGGHHFDDENLDHQKDANLAVWLGLIAVLTLQGAAVATNMYLRGWNPQKFVMPTGVLVDIPYYNTLALIVAGILLLFAGSLFRRDKWKSFNVVLAIAGLFFLGFMDAQLELIRRVTAQSPQIITTYGAIDILQFLLGIISLILFGFAAWYGGYRDKDKINKFFPVAMNVWIFTIVTSIIVLLLTDVVTVGQFAEWCGTRFTQIGK